MRMGFGYVFIVLYLSWVLYHALIKGDLKKHLNDLYALSFFVGVWLVIYYFLFTK